MRKTILGSFMILSGVISMSLLMAGSMSQDWTIDGQHSFWRNLSQYGLTPAFYAFAAIAVVGLVIAINGLIEKKQ